MNELRFKLVSACKEHLEVKTSALKQAMRELSADLENESKSSAGDKYETGREMINIEWNKLSGQLNEYQKLTKVLNRIDVEQTSNKIALGSVVKTETANYFLAIPAGTLKVGNDSYYAVGILAPVSKALLGKKTGDTFMLNAKTVEIKSVC